MSPTTMKALKAVELGKAEVKEVPLPRLRDGYILVKVTAVALNPTDWKHKNIEAIFSAGSTIGCDLAGKITQIGPNVTKPFNKGDRIAAFTHGQNKNELEDGCFAEYAVVKGDLAIKIPDNLPDTRAASLPVGVLTCNQGLYQSLGLPRPGEEKEKEKGGWLCVYGASTATGTLAVQFGVLSGYDVIAICSEKNFPLVKSLGASAAFDYKDPECGQKIRAHTHDQLHQIYDCISTPPSPLICDAALSTAGGKISYLLPVDPSTQPRSTPQNVTHESRLGYTAIGETFSKRGKEFPASGEDFQSGKEWVKVVEGLLREGRLRAHPVEVGNGNGEKGFEGIGRGLERLEKGEVSGVKLVYEM